MKNFFAPVAALLLLSCSEAPEVSIPPIQVGGPTGARLMSGQARSPMEAYEFAYASMTKHHNRLRDSLRVPPANTYAAVAALQEIVENLKVMQSVVIEPQRAIFDPLIKEYSEWHRLASSGRVNGLLPSVDLLERRVKSECSGSRVDIIDAAPAATTSPAPAPVVSKPAPVQPEPTPDPRGTPYWMIHAAWKGAHAELVEAFTKNPRGDCAAAYGRVREALASLKGLLDAGERTKLQVYLDFYAKVHDDTSGFTQVPAGDAAEHVLGDLAAVAKLIGEAFDPAKRKK